MFALNVPGLAYYNTVETNVTLQCLDIPSKKQRFFATTVEKRGEKEVDIND